jgi:DNA polymerase/3'-5' exonuclease PolX
MSQGVKLPFGQAWDLAARITVELEPACERLEIAGSLRRRRPQVGDIEIVAIPCREPSLFPDIPGVSCLDRLLLEWVQKGRLVRANRGEVLQKFYIPKLLEKGNHFTLEIYVSSFERWPVELAIRTGSAEFSHKLVTRRDQGGYLPSDCRIEGGWQVVKDGEGPLTFESERAFIEWACGRWWPPEERG